MAAYKFFESFDNWASETDAVGKGWVVTHIDAGPAIAFPAGRYGGQGINADAYPIRFAHALPEHTTELWMGMAIVTDSNFAGSAENTSVMAVTTGGTIVASLRTNINSLQFIDSAGGTQAITGFTMPAPGTWTYLEVGWSAGAAGVGTAIARQDGVSLGTITMATVGSSDYWDGFNFYTLDCSGSVGEIDDIYVNNGQGLDPGFIGPLRVAVARVAADVSNAGSAWVPSSGTTLYSMLDEIQEDGATTTISSSTDSAYALFDIGTIAEISGTVVGVQPVVVGVGEGSTVAGVVSSNGTTATTLFASLGNTYTCYAPSVIEIDPSTGERWSIASVEAMQLGVIKGTP